MKRILFIVPYPNGQAPSQRFRFEQYFNILEEKKINITVSPFWPQWGWDVLYSKGRIFKKALAFLAGVIGRITQLFTLHRYDWIFIHREAMPVGPPIIEFIIAKVFRKRLIYDFDDAIWLPNTSKQNRVVSAIKNHGKVKKICSWSQKTSCGNGFLADFASRYSREVIINPTTIDTSYHIPATGKRDGDSLVIGWTGSHSTTKYLQLLIPVLEQIQSRHNVELRIISDQKPLWDYNNYVFIPWNKTDEIAQLQAFDIGIMPLEDTIWEKGKCGFKVLQYMAMEVPAVASAVGVNNTIIEDGVDGFLCSGRQQWIDSLEKLIISQHLRRSMGMNGRKKIFDHYSVTANTPRFLSFFA